jgi:hypothetical protein
MAENAAGADEFHKNASVNKGAVRVIGLGQHILREP